MLDEHKNHMDGVLPLDKFYEIEMETVFGALLKKETIRVQLATFFGTVNLAVLSIALSTQKAGLLFFAGMLFWALVILDMRARRTLVGYFYRGLQLQTQFALGDSDVFLNIVPGHAASLVRKIAKLPEREDRIKALHRLPLRHPSIPGFWMPLGASLIEIGSGLILWLVFGWSLF